jgi:hypothetical protein
VRRVDTALWEQLIAGRLNRVVVVGPPIPNRSLIAKYLPQTLGLRPIPWFAYGPEQSDFADFDFPDLAEDLASRERWIIENVPTAWVEPFLRRADAILVFDTLWTRAESQPAPAARVAVGSLRRALSARRRKRDDASGDAMFDFGLAAKPPTGFGMLGIRSEIEAIAELDFPEKLIWITTHGQISLLRKVRAPRD